MSFSAWVEQLDGLEIPPGADSLTLALSCLDRYAALVADAVAVFDRSEGWKAEGAISVTGWLKTRRVAGGEAHQLARTGRRFGQLPVLGDAARSGELSAGQVRAVLANIPDRHVGLFASHEEALVPLLVGLSVAETAKAMDAWKAAADALNDGPPPSVPEREVHLSSTLDNRWHLSGGLDAEGGSVLQTALRLADSKDFNTPAGQRRGDALVAVARFFLDNQTKAAGGRHRPHLNIVINGDSDPNDLQGEIADTGQRLDHPTLARLLCDSALHRVLVDANGSILDYGRSVYTPPANLYNAVVARDRRCRFHGCDRPPTWGEAHHVIAYDNGGTTSIDNLAILCTPHHHTLHLPGWKAELKPDGELVITTPWGLVRSTRPPDPPGQTLIAGLSARPKRKRETRRQQETRRARTRARQLINA